MNESALNGFFIKQFERLYHVFGFIRQERRKTPRFPDLMIKWKHLKSISLYAFQDYGHNLFDLKST